MQRALAKKKFDLIIAIGFSQTDGLRRVAKQFPQLHFAIIDGVVDLPNVRSVLFEEQEGSYLVGALAAHLSKTHKIGFIGGMDIPLIRRFEHGFIAGAHHDGKPIQLFSHYIGITAEAWNNPSKAKEIALSQYAQGADIVFCVAGASGTGAFDAAEETHHLAIGVDSNQNWMKPGFILTSMMVRVDTAVYEAIRDLKNRQFQGGLVHLGLKNEGVDYALDDNNRSLIDADSLHYVEDLKKDIIAGKITVPDYLKMEHK
jgi:basic membrane protein A